MTTSPAVGSWRRHTVLSTVVAGLCLSLQLTPGVAVAATVGPPLLDITHECDTIARRNVVAMSECVVAESEARAEILQKWSRYSDPVADKCVKLGRKSRKYAYGIMAKCFAAEPADVRPVKATAPR